MEPNLLLGFGLKLVIGSISVNSSKLRYSFVLSLIHFVKIGLIFDHAMVSVKDSP